MGANLQEWHLFVTDRSKSPGRAPMIDDDSGVVYICTVGSSDSPTLYSDQNGTALTETHGHALLSLTNGQVRFWSERSVTNLDIYWFGSKTAGMFQNAHFSRHELPVNANGQNCVAAIPIGNHAVAALSSHGNTSGAVSTGWTPASNVTLLRTWAQVLSAGVNAASASFRVGTSGLSTAILVSQSVSAISYPGAITTSTGAYSTGYTFDGTEAVTFTPNSNTNSAFGALVYMELNYGNYPLD